MRVGLFGIGGLYNFGCEAIVRGAVFNIRRIAPEAEITYYSYRADEDKAIIPDLGIRVVQMQTNHSLLQRAGNAFLHSIDSKWRIKSSSYREIVKRSDVIFSIGGDIYSIPKHIRKKDKYRYYQPLIEFGDYVMKRGIKYIIYGASIGPFGQYKKAIDYYRRHLLKADLIVCREELSIRYLKQLNIINNVCFQPDPAFSVESPTISPACKEYIGLNVSPLSLNELFGEITDSTKKKLALLIVQIIAVSEIPVLLIPHVISPTSERDNDLLFMEDILQYVPNKYHDRVKLYEGKNFFDVKEGIRQCRIVVAARMHCAINAVLEGVPTIFLTYSAKAEGMAHYVYGSDDLTIPIENINERLIQMILLLLESRDKVAADLSQRIVQIRNSDMAVSTEGYIRMERILQTDERAPE